MSHLGVQLMVHHPLEAPGSVAACGGGEAVLLDVDREHGVLGLCQLLCNRFNMHWNQFVGLFCILLLFSSAEEEKRTHRPVSKLIDLQDEFPLQVSIQSLSIRVPGWLSSMSWGAVYTNPDNQDDDDIPDIWNIHNSPVMTSNDTRSAGQLSAFSWATAMDKAAAIARHLASQLLGIILATVWNKEIFLILICFVFMLFWTNATTSLAVAILFWGLEFLRGVIREKKWQYHRKMSE